MSVILRCAFGLDMDMNDNPTSTKIAKTADDMIGHFAMKSWTESFLFQLFFTYFPGIMKLIPMWPKAYDDMWKISDDIMKVKISAQMGHT